MAASGGMGSRLRVGGGVLGAAGMAVPLMALLAVAVVAPVASVVARSVQAPAVADALPGTLARLRSWQGSTVPAAPAFAALGRELSAAATADKVSRVAMRLEREHGGLGAIVVGTAHRLVERPLEPRTAAEWRDAVVAAHAAWNTVDAWTALRRGGSRITADHYRAVFDMRDVLGDATDPRRGGPRLLWSLAVGVGVALLCLVLGFPLAYLVAGSSGARATCLLAAVLVPFWITVCLRTATWIAVPYPAGFEAVFAWLFPAAGASAAARIAASLAVMTQMVLPFAVLPLYAAMRTVPRRYMSAAATLGASFAYAFRRVYWPHMRSATWAVTLLVTALAIGYHATPALAGLAAAHAVADGLAPGAPLQVAWVLPTALGSVVVVCIAALGVIYVGVRRPRHDTTGHGPHRAGIP